MNSAIKALDGISSVAELTGDSYDSLDRLIKGFNNETLKALFSSDKLSDSLKTEIKQMLKLDGATQQVTKSTSKLEGAFGGLKALIASHPIIAGAAAAAAAGYIIYRIVDSYKQKIKELVAAAKESGSAYKEQTEKIDNYADRITELRKQIDSGTLSEEESYKAKTELLQIQRDLNDINDGYADKLDLVNGKLEDQLELLNSISIAEANKWITENQGGIDEAIKQMEAVNKYWLGSGIEIKPIDQEEDLLKQIESITEQYEHIKTEWVEDANGVKTLGIVFTGNVTEADDEINRFAADMRALQEASGDEYDYSGIFGNILSDAEESARAAQNVLDENEAVYDQWKEFSLLTSKRNVQEDLTGDLKYAGTLYDLYQDYAKAVNEYNDALLGGDTSKIEEAQTKFEGVKDIVDNLAGNDALGIYEDMFDGITASVDTSSEALYNFKKTLSDEINTGNSAIASYQRELQEFNKLGVDIGQTIFGNIDLDNRQILEWTEENLEKYKDALMSWAEDGETWDDVKSAFEGNISTIFGSSAEYDGVEIAFTPILQTDKGAVLLSQNTVDSYINGLIEKACADDNSWTNEELFKLDTEGLEVDGRIVKGLLADIGDTAIQTGEAMHYLGVNGSIALAKNEVAKTETSNIKTAIEAIASWSPERLSYEVELLASGSDDASDALRDIVDVANELGVITSENGEYTEEEISSVVYQLGRLGFVVNDVAEGLSSSLNKSKENVASLISGISAAQSVLDAQSTGKSISLDTFNSGELKDYAYALEYVNGAYQLNADKVNELIKAKTEEQIAINNTNKALEQSQYLENAGQIEKLRQKIIDNNFAEGESAESIQRNIDALIAQNSAIRNTISQYDLMSSSLLEATSAYQNWLNAQNATQSGEMFDSSLSALKKINDTLNKTDSDSYGRIGNQDFKAAIDFVIPDSIDSSDETAVNNYLKSLSDILTLDDNGNFDGLNIEAFCKQAVKKGLMVLEDGEFKIAGKTTMQDFADGMNLSLPLVQAIFGEMEEFGGEFSWADEAIKTVGDLGVAAYEAAESLRNIEGNEDIKVVLDVSEFTDKQSALDTLDATIQEMNDLKAKPNVDTSEIEYANTIIQYAVAQKQMLDAPAVLSVDTSQVTGELGDALSLLQKFQETKNTIEMQAAVGADTSEAQAKLDSLASEIQNLSPEMKATLAIDTSSTESIQSYINGLDAEAIVSFGVDSSLVDAYQEAEHDSTGEVKWDNNTSAVDRYSSSIKNAFGIVNWRNDTTSVKTRFTATGTISWSGTHGGTHGLNGTAHVNGSAYGKAFVSGDWGVKQGGKKLVGELGTEIIVDPYTGRWYTVGDNGAEFVDIPKNAIVFNHKQTESLLENGYAVGRGTALASGTAMVTGGIKVSSASKSKKSSKSSKSSRSSKSSSKSSSSKSSSSKSSSSSSSTKDFEETFDWIEIAIDRIERAIDNLDLKAQSVYKSWSSRNSDLKKEISKISDEIDIQQKGYDYYLKKAESENLSSAYKKLVRDGAIKIDTIKDEDLAEHIKNYQIWYEKALNCKYAVQDLTESLGDMYQQMFELTQTRWDNVITTIEHTSTMLNDYIDQVETAGYIASTQYYKELQKVEAQIISNLQKEKNALTESMKTALLSGEIAEGSDAFYEMAKAIDEVSENLVEARTQLIEYQKKVREIQWAQFDSTQDAISNMVTESDFLLDLLKRRNAYQDNGEITDSGMAQMGLYGQNFNTYLSIADRYAKAIRDLDKEFKNDSLNQDYINRRKELVKAQQDAIEAAHDERDAIVNLVQEGIDLALKHMKELIDTYKDSLDSAKDLYEYQKKIATQTKTITNLEKQLRAYDGDTSEENRKRVQQLKVQLEDARSDLQDTQYDRYISDQKQILDDMYDQYEMILNSRFDDVDALIQECISTINANTDTIGATIQSTADQFGYTLSDSLTNVWSPTATTVNGISAALSDYKTQFANYATTLQTVLNQIAANVAAQYAASTTAKSTPKATTSVATAVKNSQSAATTVPAAAKTTSAASAKTTSTSTKTSSRTSGSSSSSSSSNSSKWGSWFVKKTDTYPKSKLNKETSIVDRLKYFNFDSSFSRRKTYYGKMGGSGTYTGTASQNTWMIKQMKAHGYRRGSSNIPYDEFAWTGEGDRPEMILRPSDNAIYTAVKAHDKVVNADGTKNLFDFANDPDGFIKSHMLGDVSRMPKITTPQSTEISNDISMTVTLPGVKNYEEFMNAARDDTKFQKMVQAMTIDLLDGRSSLGKRKINWH